MWVMEEAFKVFNATIDNLSEEFDNFLQDLNLQLNDAFLLIVEHFNA